MSSSIRPPGPSGPAGLTGSSELKPHQTEASVGAQPTATPSGAVESPQGALLRRLSAGEVSKEQAIEGLVAQALEAQGGARLSAAQRSELADVLRDALRNDPVLGELLGG